MSNPFDGLDPNNPHDVVTAAKKVGIEPDQLRQMMPSIDPYLGSDSESGMGIGDFQNLALTGAMQANKMVVDTASFLGNKIHPKASETLGLDSASQFFQRGIDAAEDLRSDRLKAEMSRPIYHEGTGELQMPSAIQATGLVTETLPMMPMFATAGRAATGALQVAGLGAGASTVGGYGATNAAFIGGDTYREAKDEITNDLSKKISADEFNGKPTVDDSIQRGEEIDLIAENYAQEAGNNMLLPGFVTGAVGLGVPALRTVDKPLSGVRARMGNAGLGAVTEGVSEFAEEAGQGMAVNNARMDAGNNEVELFDGVIDRGAKGLVGGAASGAAFGAMNSQAEWQRTVEPSQEDDIFVESESDTIAPDLNNTEQTAEPQVQTRDFEKEFSENVSDEEMEFVFQQAEATNPQAANDIAKDESLSDAEAFFKIKDLVKESGIPYLYDMSTDEMLEVATQLDKPLVEELALPARGNMSEREFRSNLANIIQQSDNYKQARNVFNQRIAQNKNTRTQSRQRMNEIKADGLRKRFKDVKLKGQFALARMQERSQQRQAEKQAGYDARKSEIENRVDRPTSNFAGMAEREQGVMSNSRKRQWVSKAADVKSSRKRFKKKLRQQQASNRVQLEMDRFYRKLESDSQAQKEEQNRIDWENTKLARSFRQAEEIGIGQEFNRIAQAVNQGIEQLPVQQREKEYAIAETALQEWVDEEYAGFDGNTGLEGNAGDSGAVADTNEEGSVGVAQLDQQPRPVNGEPNDISATEPTTGIRQIGPMVDGRNGNDDAVTPKWKEKQARIDSIAKNYVGKLQGETGQEQVAQIMADGYSEMDAQGIATSANMMEMAEVSNNPRTKNNDNAINAKNPPESGFFTPEESQSDTDLTIEQVMDLGPALAGAGGNAGVGFGIGNMVAKQARDVADKIQTDMREGLTYKEALEKARKSDDFGTEQFEKAARQVYPNKASVIDAAANEAATSPTNDLPEPTQAQKEAGNYKKGKVRLHGLDISIENPKGSKRKGVDESGKAWETTMQHHYGDIKTTKGADGDAIDVFIGENTDSEKVFVVDQVNPDTGAFDEAKVMMGFDSVEDATKAYQSNYDKDWKGLGNITETNVDEFKQWIKKPRKSKQPFAELPQATKKGQNETQNSPVNDEQSDLLNEILNDEGLTVGNRIAITAFQLGKSGSTLDKILKNVQIKGGLKQTLHKKIDKFRKQLTENSAPDKTAPKNPVKKTGTNDSITGAMPQPETKKPKSKLDVVADAVDQKQKAAVEELAALIKSRKGTLNSGVDPEVMLAVAKVGGYTIAKGTVKFSQWVRDVLGLTRQAGIQDSDVVPHLKEAYGAITANPEKYEVSDAQADRMDLTRTVAKSNLDEIVSEIKNVPATSNNVEQASTSGNTEQQPGNSDAIESDGLEQDAGTTERPTGETVRAGSVPSISNDDGAVSGAPSTEQVFDQDGAIRPDAKASNTGKSGRSNSNNDARVSLESDTAPAVTAATTKLESTKPTTPLSSRKSKWGEQDDILKAVPVLMPEQASDIALIENRFFGEDNPGLGYQNTNGTGTGKTFVGLGLTKRFEQNGKDNILIVVPNDGIARQWVKAGKDFFNMEVNMLGSGGTPKTKDAGKGITITTYATFGQNNALIKDRGQYDLIIADESQNLMASQQSKETKALSRLRAATNHERGSYKRARVMYADQQEALDNKIDKKLKELLPITDSYEAAQRDAKEYYQDEQRAIDAKINAERDKLLKQGQFETKVLFLSATPYPYVKNLDYAEGYVFNYTDYGDKHEGGYDNAFHGHNAFYIQNFGYRWRYHKLNTPGAEVDQALMERMFHENLKNKGVLGGRTLEVEADYKRDFIKVETAAGEKLDELIDKWRNHEVEVDGKEYPERPYSELAETLRKKFDYTARIKLTEAIKAEEAAERALDHINMGRKVVIFHSYNVGGSFDPIAEVEKEHRDLMAQFNAEFPGMTDINFGFLERPLDLFKEKFGDKVRFYNGNESDKARAEAKELFNQDDSGVDVIVIQQEAGEAGISLHDVTGKHQRVLINIGMPVKPTQLIQIEGRTYRVGVQTDAHFENLTTGTAFEREIYASRIAGRASTAENLAMGEMARTLKENIAEGYLDAEYKPAQTLIGKGGKESDRPGEINEWDKSISLYYSNLKRTGKTKSAEGSDYFATPEPLGKKMVEWAQAKPGTRTLEPSIGHGAIGRWFGGTTRNKAMEPSYKLYSLAQMNFAGDVINDKFESLNVINKFETIVMNPPFGQGGKLAYDHIEKAITHLTNGGRIVALVPDGPSANKRLNKLLENDKYSNIYQASEIDLPQGVFERAGTNVKTKIVVLDRFDDQADAPQFQRVNFTGTKDVKELFERIKDVELKERKTPTPKEVDPELYMTDGRANSAGYSVSMNGTLNGTLTDILNEEAVNVIGGKPSRDGKKWTFETDEQRADFKAYAARTLAEAEESGVKLNFPAPPKSLETVEGQGANEHFVSVGDTYTTKRGKEFIVTEMQAQQDYSVYTALKELAKEFGGWARGTKFMFKTAEDVGQFNELGAKLINQSKGNSSVDGVRFNKANAESKNGGVKAKAATLAFKRFMDHYKGLDDNGFEQIITDKKPSEIFGPSVAADDNYIKGAFDKGTNRMFIFAQNHKSIEDVRQTIREELLVHKGLGVFSQEEIGSLITRINDTRNSKSKKVREIWEDIAQNYGGIPPLHQAEEFLGKVAQKRPSFLDKHLTKVLAQITKMLRKAGLVKQSITMSEMRSEIYRIGELLAKGKQPENQSFDVQGAVDSGMRFNKSKPKPKAKSEIKQRLQNTMDLFGRKGMFKMLPINQMVDLYDNTFTKGHIKKYYDLLESFGAYKSKALSAIDEGAETRWDVLQKENPKANTVMSRLMVNATMAQMSPDRSFSAQQIVMQTRDTINSLKREDNPSASQDRYLQDLEVKLIELEGMYKQLADDWRYLERNEPRAVELYKEVRKAYIDKFNETKKALLDRIMELSADEQTKGQLISMVKLQFEKQLQKGDYFPLMRNGRFAVIARKGNEYIREHFEYPGEAREAEERYKAQGFNVTRQTMADMDGNEPLQGYAMGVQVLNQIKEMRNENIGEDIQMELADTQSFVEDMGELFKSVNNKIEADSLMDSIYQEMLKSLPNSSAAKSFIHRNRTKGASNDSRRAFANSMFHSINRIAKIKYEHKFAKELDAIKGIADTTSGDDQHIVRDIHESLKERNNKTLNPDGGPVAAMLSGLGFNWLLGGSLAAGAVNLSQVPLVTFPYLSSKYGNRKASKAMMQAYGELRGAKINIKKGKGIGGTAWRTLSQSDSLMDLSKSEKLSEQERELLHKLADDGKIDLTQMHAMAQIADTEMRDNHGFKLPFTNKTINKKSFVDVQRAWGFFFHNAEVVNRQVTALSTIRLAKENDSSLTSDQLYDLAANAIDETQFNYASYNRGMWAREDFGKIALMFMTYTVNIITLMAKNSRRMFAGDKEARKFMVNMMGAHFLAAGAIGLPLVEAIGDVIFALKDAVDGDDEPDDFKKWMDETIRQSVALFGGDPNGDAAHMVSTISRKGIINGLTGVNIADRVGLNNLIWRSDNNPDATGSEMVSNMLMGASPVFSIAANFLNGTQRMGQGIEQNDEELFLRGLQGFMPKAAGDVAKGFRQYNYGESTLTGTELIGPDQINAWNAITQSLGFSTEKVRDLYERRSRQYKYDKVIAAKRNTLVRKTANAVMNGENMDSLLTDITKYNEQFPSQAITPDTIRRHILAKQRRDQQTINGIYTPKKQLGEVGKMQYYDN